MCRLADVERDMALEQFVAKLSSEGAEAVWAEAVWQNSASGELREMPPQRPLILDGSAPRREAEEGAAEAEEEDVVQVEVERAEEEQAEAEVTATVEAEAVLSGDDAGYGGIEVDGEMEVDAVGGSASPIACIAQLAG
eukprot:7226069-Prymnesium_polylepis.2